ncbi:unnamed protein product, partial [Medioppia subpectinata]
QQIVPLVDLIITHGGNNTVCEVFPAGKPMIVLPLNGDQYNNAQRVDELGFGVRLDAYKCTSGQLLAAIDRLLNDKQLYKRLDIIADRIKRDNSISNQTLATSAKPWEPEGKMYDLLWALRHHYLAYHTAVHKADERIVFVGDSITLGWELLGANVWSKYYGAGRHAYNYGISGDTTSNLIFRIRSNEFDGLEPNVTVLMIGTNNVWHNNDTAEDVKHGIDAIMKELLTKMPTTKILLLGNLPAPWPDQCKQLNALLEKLANNKSVFFLDMWSAFVDKTGRQNADLFVSDGIHPNESGYEVWHKTMDPLLRKLYQLLL